jgi:thioredoxin reductase (NADPH)
LKKVEIEHLPTKKISELKTDGTFIFVGYQPNTESIKDLVLLNDRNEIVVDATMKTNIDGVFAAGDCIAKRYRQVTTAVAEGTIAALSAADYLRN